jgi:hypothetical protein
MGALRPLYFSVYRTFLANLTTIYIQARVAAGNSFRPHNYPIWVDFKSEKIWY